MKARFVINKKKYQVNSEEPCVIFNRNVLLSICKSLTGQCNYEVEWLEERNEGRLAILETQDKTFFVTITGANPQAGRNSYYQSVPTALRMFLGRAVKSKFEFVVCVQGDEHSHLTKYQMFISRVILTAGIRIIEVTSGLYSQWGLSPYGTVRELISARNDSKEENSGNNSTYITDEGSYYHVYGKTFGSNGKETTMLCFALMHLSTKPIRLFQILDNETKQISSMDKTALETFSNFYDSMGLEVLDDTYEINEFTSETYKPIEKTPLRSQRFIYSLLQKTNGHKKCALCNCEVQPLIQAAHIYGVAEIKSNNGLSDEQKVKMANDGENGLWLCMHHHKLFDSYQIYISLDKVGILSSIKDEIDLNYIKSSITEPGIGEVYRSAETKKYFEYREKVKDEIHKWCAGKANDKPLQDYYTLNT